VFSAVAVKDTPFAEAMSPCALKVMLSSRLVGAPLKSRGTMIVVSAAPATEATEAAPKVTPGLAAVASATAVLM
jgi:hypothetical protein